MRLHAEDWIRTCLNNLRLLSTWDRRAAWIPLMELYQQFLLTEDILKNIINDAKQNIQATFKEITAALGGIETHVDDDVLSEDIEKQYVLHN